MHRFNHLLNVLRNVVVIALLLALACFGPIFSTATSWLASELFALLLVISLVSLAWPLAALKLAPEDENVYGDDALGPKLSLSGRGFFLALQVRQGKTRVWQGAYFGRQQALQLPKPLARGVYQNLPIIVSAGDPFSWMKKTRQLKLAAPLLVLPRKEAALSSQVGVKLAQLTGKNAPAGDAPSFVLRAFRDYAPGDPVTTIDWKATAKHDKMIVRLDEPEKVPLWQAVFINQGGDGYELALGLYNSLTATHYLFEHHPIAAAGGLEPKGSRRHLAALQPEPDLPHKALAELPPGKALVVFCGCDLTFTQAAQLLPKRPLILVSCTQDAATVSTERQSDRFERRRA